MATAASDEEQVVEIVPAAPDPHPEQQQQARDVTAHQGSEEVAVPTKVKEALSKLHSLRPWISQLLGPAGPQRVGVTTGDCGRRCLAFLETEMSITAAFLTTTLSPKHYLDVQTKTWLRGYCSLAIDRAYGVLRQVDPSCHSLLRRASQCFHRRKSYSHSLPLDTVTYYYFNEHPCPSRHRHLLLTSSDLWHTTPQLAEEPGALLPLVGIDRLAKKIFSILTRQGWMSMHLRVVSIVGPVGIGKTTLAVELRNRFRQQHETCGGHCSFGCYVMAQASRGTDRNILLLQDILSQVSKPAATPWSSDPSSSQANTMKVLVLLVSECLRDKRYFIIIDDIWEASDWEKIKGAFPNNYCGSQILITTRSTNTAWAISYSSYNCLVHEIKPLSKMDSQRLLLAKAVGSVDCCLPNNMKLRCDEILRRCDGIPLFIIGMADWLKEQGLQQLHQPKDEDEEHQGFAMHYEELVPRLPERLEQALTSAFNDLPYDELTSLSLYMSMFPYGYKFEKDRLILKWKHEGLIYSGNLYLEFREEKNEDNKSEAEMFFSELVDRNVITCVASSCQHKQDEAEDCQWQVNRFIQQFLASKCAEMGFIFTTTTLNLLTAAAATTTIECGNQTSSKTPRRLALHLQDPLLPSQLETMDLSQTRSLSVSGPVKSGIIPLHRFVNLVVLDLEAWENLKDEDLLQVCRSKMIFLSYLSVRKTPVSKLPHEVKELQTLRILDISYTQISELPLELFELTCLFHLDLRGTRISQLPEQIVGLEGALQDLLIGGGEGTINLIPQKNGTINSVETAVRVPHDVQHLYKLQTLATVDLTEQPASFVRALGDLHRLKVLAFTWSFHQSIDRDYCEALLSSISKWIWLESLTIHCGLGCSMEFLGSLEESGAPRRLKKFKVTAGRFASVPRWIYGLWRLAFVQITVRNKQTTTNDLKILGALPKLECLILGLDFIPSQAIVIGNKGFCELDRFSIECPMPWLIFQAGSMPRLTHLKLKFSSGPASEERVPSGISNLSSIREVVLSYSKWYANSKSVEMTLKAVREQVANHYNRNPIDLFINDEEDDGVQAVDEEATGTPSGTDDAQAVDDEEATGTPSGSDDAQAVDDEEATGVAQTENTEAEGWQASLAYCALLFAAAYMYLLWSDGVSVWWSVVNAALLTIYMLCSQEKDCD